MKNKKNKKKTIILVCSSLVILLLLFIIVIFQDKKQLNKFEALLKDIVIGIEKVITYPIYQNRKENIEDQTESYIIQKKINDTLMKEIEELKKTLELNQTLTDYEVINATILSRSPNYWYQNLTIDKGSNSGLKEDMVVITKQGLIGKLSKVSSTTSEVKLITNNDTNYKISVEVVTEEGNIPAILNGYDIEEKSVIITGIDNHTNVSVGDNVITSGLGGVFPRGIYIGQIKKIESEKYDISKKLKVDLLQDFNDIHYVSILKRKS